MNKSANQQDVGQLFVEHRPKLKSFISKRVANKEEAEDILQDVFYQFLKTLENTMHPIEQVSAWLYRVARNLIINNGLKKKEILLPDYAEDNSEDDVLSGISEILFHNETSPSPETEYLRSLVWVELDNALAELPTKQREVFELTELEGLPLKDIAETTGVAVNTLLSRKHYAVKHLRKRLADLYGDLVCD